MKIQLQRVWLCAAACVAADKDSAGRRCSALRLRTAAVQLQLEDRRGATCAVYVHHPPDRSRVVVYSLLDRRLWGCRYNPNMEYAASHAFNSRYRPSECVNLTYSTRDLSGQRHPPRGPRAAEVGPVRISYRGAIR